MRSVTSDKLGSFPVRTVSEEWPSSEESKNEEEPIISIEKERRSPREKESKGDKERDPECELYKCYVFKDFLYVIAT